jgi:hypothetical protein
MRDPSVRVFALTVLFMFLTTSSVTIKKPEPNELLYEEQLIDGGLVSRIECM